MKVLIVDASLFLPDTDELFVKRGYIYVQRGATIVHGASPPPPELEYAEYIIDGRGKLATYGFVVGIGDILDYALHSMGLESVNLTSLTKDEVYNLIAATLANLNILGATSVVSLLNANHVHYASVIAKAVCDAWTRLKLLIPATVEDPIQIVREFKKTIKDEDAVNEGIISLGLYISRGDELDRIRLSEVVSLLDVDIFVHREVLNAVPQTMLRDLAEANLMTCINCDDASVPRRFSLDEVFGVNAGLHSGAFFSQPEVLNPKRFLQLVSSKIRDPVVAIKIAQINNRDSAMYIRRLKRVPKDIVVMDFRGPPFGPMRGDMIRYARSVVEGNYSVESVIIGGYPVVDRGLHLNVGDAVFKKVFSIIESFNE